MIAIRTDKDGLVTSINFSVGVNGGKEDAIKLVQNALKLSKNALHGSFLKAYDFLYEFSQTNVCNRFIM